MSAFLFYEPNGSANRYSNKERFRAHPRRQVLPVNRDVVGISEPTCESSYGMMDTASKTLQTLPLERAFQRETTSCTSAIGDDCFDEAQMSDGGDSLRSLFSDFTDDRLGDAEHNSVNGLAPVKHLPSATVSHAATDANPAPSEFGSFGQSQPVAGSAPFAVGYRQHDSSDHIDARQAFSLTCMPPIRNFTEIDSDSVTFADPLHNDLAIIDLVNTTYTEAGTQTDHPDVTLSDREMQTDQYGTEATNSKEGRPFSVLIQTRETLDNSYEQHDEHVGNQRRVNTTDSIETNRQNIPDLVATVSAPPPPPMTPLPILWMQPTAAILYQYMASSLFMETPIS